MLAKLIKYEIKDTARLFLPFYAALLIFAVINTVFLHIGQGLPRLGAAWSISFFLTMTVYMLLFATIIALTFIVVILRFYRNLLGNEGYLMFTLPATTWQHILSKLTVGFLWTICSGIVAGCSLMIFTVGTDFLPQLFTSIGQVLQEVWIAMGAHLIAYIIELILVVVVELATGIGMIYAAIAIGHMVNRHRILGSFGAFLVIQVAIQMIGSLVVLLFLNDHLLAGFALHPFSSLHLLFIGSLLLNVAIGGVLFFITHRILDRHLNLE